jgi:hypothetical protein
VRKYLLEHVVRRAHSNVADKETEAVGRLRVVLASLALALEVKLRVKVAATRRECPLTGM